MRDPQDYIGLPPMLADEGVCATVCSLIGVLEYHARQTLTAELGREPTFLEVGCRIEEDWRAYIESDLGKARQAQLQRDADSAKRIVELFAKEVAAEHSRLYWEIVKPTEPS